MERKAYNGGALNIIGDMFDAHMRGCLKAIENNPELIINYDLETGFPFVETKEQNKRRQDVWENCISKTLGNKLDGMEGKIIFFGTGGQINKTSFEELFYNTDK